MKFTEKYIKMADTPEIQDNWKPERGDWYVYDDNLDNLHVINTVDIINKQTQCQKIWLPLQHQLQEMVRGKRKFGSSCNDFSPKFFFFDLYEFGNEWEWLDCGNVRRFETPTELTLAYVMHELHQKKWNNTKGVWE